MKEKLISVVLVFVAMFTMNPLYCQSEETIKDVDGNTYKTVAIGTQLWMAENLKTTKFSDGSEIPFVKVESDWISLTTPAYCWYYNDANYKDKYGALYNWYTVNSDKLCPDGWSVPSDEDWKALTEYLGGESIAGGKLKVEGNSHWFKPNTDADNSSGFTALPGGYRFYDNGYYGDAMAQGNWWSATEYSEKSAFSRIMFSNGAGIQSSRKNKKYGLSVRCIKK